MSDLRGNGGTSQEGEFDSKKDTARFLDAHEQRIDVPITNTGGLALCLCGYLAGYPFAGSTITGCIKTSPKLASSALSLKKDSGITLT